VSDIELLEMAAKARGRDFHVFHETTHIRFGGGSWLPWNPLNNDGDALRLAVDLHLNIEHVRDVRDESQSGVFVAPANGCNIGWFEPVGKDDAAATRRAIVRAAAAIAGAAL
jgi:hypothetical protein